MPMLDLTVVESEVHGGKKLAPKKVERVSFKELGKNFIPFSFVVLFIYSTFLPYNSNLNLLLRTRFAVDGITAGKIIVRIHYFYFLGLPNFGDVILQSFYRCDE